MIRLGVNIDHIATVRNARGENHPDIILSARYAMKYGADLITVHLREDRRHINELDLKIIKKNLKIEKDLKILDLRKINVNKIILFELEKRYYL